MAMASLNTATAAPSPILVVDDSAVARAMLGRMIEATGRYAMAGAVATAEAALAFLAGTRVAYILLDINLPGRDGLAALPDLIAAGQGAKVIVVSAAAASGGVAEVQALALGAADALFKPAAGERITRFAEVLVEKLDALADGGASDPTPAAPPVRPPAPMPMVPGNDFDIIAIGASTGGIHALGSVLREIPQSCRVPILVTQHLPASFMPFFAAQVAVLAGRPCEVAVDRLRIAPGRVIVAPGDAHIRVVPLTDGAAAVRLSHEDAASGCRPSVDPMLASLAQVYGARALGIVLSGMGRDGAQGAKRLHDAGGCVVVQDAASSVIWGMPGAVAATGAAAAILPPDAIGRLAAMRRRP